MIATKHLTITYEAGISATKVSKPNAHCVDSLHHLQSWVTQSGLGHCAMSSPDTTASLSMTLKACPSPVLLHFKASLRSSSWTSDKEPENWLCPSLTHLTLGTWASMLSCIKWASRPVNQRSFLHQIS